MPQNRYWYLLSKKLAGEASSAEEEELNELLKSNPDWSFEAQHLFDIWNIKPSPDKYGAEEAFQLHLEKMRSAGISTESLEETGLSISKSLMGGNKRSFIQKLILYPSLALAACTLVFFLLINQQQTSEVKLSEVITRPGSKTKLVLPDGSIVWLNSGSKLTYKPNFGKDNRDLTLSGEGFFEVVKNPDLPFIVQTPTIQVRVLGTAFNLKAYEEDLTTETALVHGKVEIQLKDRPGESYILKPNEKLTVKNGNSKSIKQHQYKSIPIVSLSSIHQLEGDSLVEEAAWIKNKMLFKDETFEEVIQKMERWYNVNIHVESDAIRSIRLTGMFEHENLYEALEALQKTAEFRYRSVNNTIYIFQ